MGSLHEAGQLDQRSAFIVEVRNDSPPVFPANAVSAVFGGQRGAAHGWISISSTGSGAAALAQLAREARYTGELLERQLIAGPVARFDAIDHLGPYQLLFRLWGSHDLERFIKDALGDLVPNDRRGTLRQTLLTFLECGGSHVDAARQLNIHRNTLAYRLKQIADTAHRDPADPSSRLTLHLALLGTMLPPVPG
jgi:DNA-binding PucR family transcriptional regulator